MRLAIATLVALMLFGLSVANAASAYEDVPRDHWAYNALDYLTERGVLEGYPDGFFKGDRTLTRYEFAQAIARLLDTMSGGITDEHLQIMANTLRAEFSDQLAEMGREIDAMYGTINDMDAALSDLDSKVGDNAGKIKDLEKKVKGLKPGTTWKGSIRYRWQFEERGDMNRFRQRVAFKIGYTKKVNDAVKVGFRLATNTGKDALSSNFTLGSKYGATADIYLDQAYIKYSPAWFGYYTDKDCNPCIPKLDIYAGMWPKKAAIYDPHEMVLDGDINPQGLGLVYHFNADFQIMTTASVFVEHKGTDYFDDDTYLFTTEIKHDNFLIPCLDVWAGCYGWKNESRLPGDVFEDNGMRGFDFNNDGVVDGNDRFSPNFNTVKGGLQYTAFCLFDKPFSVFGEYMVNIDSTADDRIALVNPYIDPDIIYEDTDDIGWVAGAQLGSKPKHCGDWYMFGRYKEIGANAIIDGYGDSDAGGANVNSLEVHWAYMWADKSLLGITYFLNKMNNAFGFLIPSSREDHSIIQIDWSFSF